MNILHRATRPTGHRHTTKVSASRAGRRRSPRWGDGFGADGEACPRHPSRRNYCGVRRGDGWSRSSGMEADALADGIKGLQQPRSAVSSNAARAYAPESTAESRATPPPTRTYDCPAELMFGSLHEGESGRDKFGSPIWHESHKWEPTCSAVPRRSATHAECSSSS